MPKPKPPRARFKFYSPMGTRIEGTGNLLDAIETAFCCLDNGAQRVAVIESLQALHTRITASEAEKQSA